jgi:hypothetical protein
MTETKFYSPLKIGLLVVTAAYFLFSLHAVLTLEWIGEWNRFGGGFSFPVYVEDITGFAGMVFRLIAGLVAFAAIVYYLVKRGMTKPTAIKLTRIVVVLEGIYWLGLISSTYFTVQNLVTRASSFSSTEAALISLSSTGTLIIESIIIPVALFILAYNLSLNKPQKKMIKWALITGTFYILLFWISNTSNWQYAIRQKGWEYLTGHPENMLNFALTTIGLLALTIYTAYFAIRSFKVDSLDKLNLRAAGAIILALGMYFLWNYLTWIYFGGNAVWSYWYAWFLGHNLDLWLLSLPLIGLPLLFASKPSKDLENMTVTLSSMSTKVLLALEAIGAIFIGIYLSAYLGGIPTTVVYHSELAFRIPLAIFGGLILVLALILSVFASRSKKLDEGETR